MKSWTKFAGCGAAAMLLLLASCGGGKKEATVNKPVVAPETAKAADAAAPGKDAAALKPGEAAPAKPAPFSAEMSAEFTRKVMETSARIDAVKKRIADRQAVIFDTHPEVKAYRAQLIEMQREIARIVDADAELAALKLDRDIFWTTMPAFPRVGPQGGSARGFGPMK